MESRITLANGRRFVVGMAAILFIGLASAAPWPRFSHGIGMGGWLTNYKRFNVLPEEHRLPITS